MKNAPTRSSGTLSLGQGAPLLGSAFEICAPEIKEQASMLSNMPGASTDALRAERAQAAHTALVQRKLKLNMTRGKPSTEQVALANALLTAVTPETCFAEDGSDCRNYFGDPRGLIEVRRIFAPMLGAPPEQVLAAN